MSKSLEEKLLVLFIIAIIGGIILGSIVANALSYILYGNFIYIELARSICELFR